MRHTRPPWPRISGGPPGLQSRDPFSGDCDPPRPGAADPGTGGKPCRAETRSQGIATKGEVTAKAQADPGLQSRDPFSGDCDPPGSRSDAGFVAGAPCRAETRSQGIATSTSRGRSPSGWIWMLAEPRPVLRGLRRAPALCRSRSRDTLQSRDPFSGDCDGMKDRRRTGTPRAALQSRDPFSGDCD